MATKPATKELIQAATVNRVVEKSTGKVLGYLVKSNSTEQYYQVSWSEEEHCYQCNCAATRECCHIKAVREVCQARKQFQPVQAQKSTISIPVATIDQAAKTRKVIEQLTGPKPPMVARVGEVPLHGSKPSPVAAGSGNPTPVSGWVPMR